MFMLPANLRANNRFCFVGSLEHQVLVHQNGWAVAGPVGVSFQCAE